MRCGFPAKEHTGKDYNERFSRFFRLFIEIDQVEGLFPRQCRVCQTTFAGMAEYCSATKPKAHCFEDCRGVDSTPFMMVYRHCSCGNTLVLTLGEKAFPSLDSFWQMLQDEAEESGRTLKEVVTDFTDQFDRYLLSLNNPCAKRAE